ncbi:hypothetical protein GA0111570_1094 [Raineyella antarctica]|uniref:Uncharacterized protein n=1 Tax=Raineyella antarctica TaxID=1577474 RepID=A0A1G6HDY0_9ACTN|nr:hypothetical protein [Raineyella antarctica]SDB92298.1 hypothetical protein GA0111570_1094 [Raineyella antarctica]
MTASPHPIKHFLLVYDRAEGHQVAVEEFGTDSAAAVRRYQELEREHASNPRMDIVLVGSDSLDTVRVTHANYFVEGAATVEALESYLRSFSERFVY